MGRDRASSAHSCAKSRPLVNCVPRKTTYSFSALLVVYPQISSGSPRRKNGRSPGGIRIATGAVKPSGKVQCPVVASVYAASLSAHNSSAVDFENVILRSFLITLPPFITNLTRCSSVISASGSPETAIRSAYLPLSMDPIWSCHPSASALIVVRALDGPRRSQPRVLHQRFEFERLRSMRESRAIRRRCPP